MERFPSLVKEAPGASWIAVVLSSPRSLRPGFQIQTGSTPSGQGAGARPRAFCPQSKSPKKETESSSSGPAGAKQEGPWGSSAASLEGSGQGQPCVPSAQGFDLCLCALPFPDLLGIPILGPATPFNQGKLQRGPSWDQGANFLPQGRDVIPAQRLRSGACSQTCSLPCALWVSMVIGSWH